MPLGDAPLGEPVLGDVAVPGWAEALHRIVSHGQATDKVQAEHEQWHDHLIRLQSHEPHRLPAEVARSALAHVGHRVRFGEPTGLVVGLLLLPAVLASLSFSLMTATIAEPSAHLHLAIGMALLAGCCLRWPRGVPRWALAVTGAVIATGLVRFVSQWGEVEPADYSILAGAAVTVCACVAVAIVSLFLPERHDQWTPHALTGAAAGIALIAVGTLQWSSIAEERSYAITCLVAGATLLLVANSLFRTRRVIVAG